MSKSETIKILNVKVNRIITTRVLEEIKSFLLLGGQHYIVTLNPEMIVEAQKDKYLEKIINEADIVIPDGVGILLASRFINRKTLPERITGVDLIYKICEFDFVKGKKIYLVGAEKGIAKEAAKALMQKYNYLDIVGAEEGIRFEISNIKYQISNKSQNSELKIQKNNKFFVILNLFQNLLLKIRLLVNKSQIHFEITDDIYKSKNNELVQRINEAQPDILFVAFGAPKQEKWIYENIKKMPSVKLAIGVGGSFDFISGKIKRAPLIFQKLGLEWLWRLILEPCRIKRIYTATLKFGWLVLKS
jgi:N-acetylglucosaminyldiphosphoundecaprenol N-acetyl-beta-D-mannosaminyltransferase